MSGAGAGAGAGSGAPERGEEAKAELVQAHPEIALGKSEKRATENLLGCSFCINNIDLLGSAAAYFAVHKRAILMLSNTESERSKQGGVERGRRSRE